MSNTPLNADDELLTKMRRLGEKYYGNELYGEHLQYQHELQKLLLADRKKHELKARIETVVYIDSMLRFENIPLHPVQAESLKQYLRQLEAQQEEVR